MLFIANTAYNIHHHLRRVCDANIVTWSLHVELEFFVHCHDHLGQQREIQYTQLPRMEGTSLISQTPHRKEF